MGRGIPLRGGRRELRRESFITSGFFSFFVHPRAWGLRRQNPRVAGFIVSSVGGIAALWLSLALLASLLSIWLRVATPIAEIFVGIFAQLIIGAAFGRAMPGGDESWIRFLSNTGAIVLTFLAGAEFDRQVFRIHWKEAASAGLASFFLPFVGCAAGAHYALGWGVMPSWLAGVAMATTSVAIVYGVMLESGLNTIGFGKSILAACFVTDLVTVIALGLIFAPFTLKTVIFLVIAAMVYFILPWLMPRLLKRYGGLSSEVETKFLLVCLLGMGALANWADSEAVLPAYLIGMALSASVGKDHTLIMRLRTLTFGLLTPFFFLHVGVSVSLPALITAPAAFLFFLVVTIATKVAGVYPVSRHFGSHNKEAIYTALLMSTGLTFGTIASRFGFSHDIIDGNQYSALVSAVIASAVIPMVIANAFFLPRHLLPAVKPEYAPDGLAGVLPFRQFSLILHAHDGSEQAFHALKLALAIAKQNDADLHMISVEKPGHMPKFVEQGKQDTKTGTGETPGTVERARAMAEASRVTLHTHVVAGHPVQSIVQFAAELKADLLVMGEGGHSALYERVFGSRTDRIKRLAQCPVLIAR